MAPEPVAAEGIARAISSLPAALYVGDVSGPLNAEATKLAQRLDRKIAEIQTDISASLELCHPGNEPSAGRLKDDMEALRSGGRCFALCRAVE